MKRLICALFGHEILGARCNYRDTVFCACERREYACARWQRDWPGDFRR